MGIIGVVCMWAFFIAALLILNSGTYDNRTK